MQSQPPGHDPQQPPSAPEVPPAGYTGQAPPGGWQQPVAPMRPVWAGPPLASWGVRLGAALLDGVVQLVAVLVLIVPGVVLLIADATAAGIVLLVLGGLGYVLVLIFYGGYFMKRPGERNGQTPGKQWLGIRVVRDNGEPFNLGQGILREFVVKQLLFGWVGGSLFFGIPWLIDYLWPLWDDQNRALHDMIVSSHVVQAARA
jgi:uncharacterized RDD family membrane protein YckC